MGIHQERFVIRAEGWKVINYCGAKPHTPIGISNSPIQAFLYIPPLPSKWRAFKSQVKKTTLVKNILKTINQANIRRSPLIFHVPNSTS
ncbi:Acetolactate synthase catalytic subunit, mitochondrial [Sesbania bispinosa]|nr:Acetolactate synthase catalytic subunit, mitochondrial [Sesbania bispinosa]